MGQEGALGYYPVRAVGRHLTGPATVGPERPLLPPQVGAGARPWTHGRSQRASCRARGPQAAAWAAAPPASHWAAGCSWAPGPAPRLAGAEGTATVLTACTGQGGKEPVHQESWPG